MAARTFFSWLKGSKTSRPVARNHKPMRRFVPRVEALEAREVPALFTVNTLVDENNGIGTGGVSLREAIAAANSQAGDDTIQFSVAGTIDLTGALPDLTSNINITGPGADQLTVRRDTGGDYAVFSVGGGATVGISGLTITNGSAINGGGIANGGTLVLTDSTVTGNTAWFGGGFINNGTMTVTNSTVSGNSAIRPGGGVAQGGGIFNAGTLTVTGSTFSGNSATDVGGGIMNGNDFTAGTLTVINSTFSGNSGRGAGIYNGSQDVLTVINSTITNNSGQGGGLYNASGVLPVLNNTIVAGNTGPSGSENISGLVDVANSFNNLIGTGNTGGLTTGSNGNIIGVDVALVLNLTLANNGGPTKTHALIPGSPAINAGSDSCVPTGITTDQHGFVRISGAAVDIGAFEFSQNQAPALSLPGAQATFEDVAVTINGISFGEPDGSTKSVTLRVGHGKLTLANTDGVTISGNGKAVVKLSGSIADLNAALVGLVYRGALNFGGIDSLQVTVSDGSLTTSGRVSITVKSSFRQAADLRAQVTALRTAGVLTAQQAYSLNVNLFLSGTSFDIGKVKTFLNRVQAFLQSSILTQAQADSLLGPGNTLLSSVKKR